MKKERRKKVGNLFEDHDIVQESMVRVKTAVVNKILLKKVKNYRL